MFQSSLSAIIFGIINAFFVGIMVSVIARFNIKNMKNKINA